MQCKTALLELLLELVVVNMVLIFPTNEDHQVIMTIFWHQYIEWKGIVQCC